MTSTKHAVEDGRRTAPVPVRSRPGRVIAVGIRDLRHDDSALVWALSDARSRVDAVQLVHAYTPAAIDELQPAPRAAARDLAFLRSWDILAAAVERGSEIRPDVGIVGSPTPGPADEVLTGVSGEVAVLVIGDDDPATPERRIAARLRRTARCPVVCVPRGGYLAAKRDVIVVATDLGLPDHLVRFAADLAARHGVGLQVARTWQSLHRDHAPRPDALAEEHALLDAQLGDVRRDFPAVPVVSRIEFDPSWLGRVRADSSVVVVGGSSAPLLGLEPPLPEPVCPVAYVPDAVSGPKARAEQVARP